MYNLMYKFMHELMCKCLGSGPDPRPQWELLGHDPGPGRALVPVLAHLPLTPWAGPDPGHLYMKLYMNLYMELYMNLDMNLYMKPYMNLYMKPYMNLNMKPYMK